MDLIRISRIIKVMGKLALVQFSQIRPNEAVMTHCRKIGCFFAFEDSVWL